MATTFDPIHDPTYGELMRVIRRVRARWRLKVALRGLAMLAAAGFAAFVLSVWGMDRFLYGERAVQIFRWLTWVALAALAVRLFVVPLAQRVSRRQVALYVEEHEPTLRASILSAVELGPVRQGAPRDAARVSPELQQRVLEEAIERCQGSGFASRIERGPLRRFSAALLGVAGAGMAAVLLSPAFLQHGAMLLFAPWRAMAADNPYQLRVSPGNATVARGSDQLISAAVPGFDPDRVEVALRPLDANGDPDGDWTRWPMNRVNGVGDLDAERMIGDTPASHDFIALNLRADTDYYVDASGIRSPIYRIRVKDLPYVERIDLEYRFPAYSGLSARKVEDGGDIAALAGTEVLFSVLPIFDVPRGRLLIEGEEAPIDLVAGDGRLTAAYTVGGATYYRIELMDDEGRWHRASAEYVVTVLEDQPPAVRFTDPGRDVRATLVEEVFLQVEAEDDYGISRLGLRYAKNGGAETAVNLLDSRASMKKVDVGHTLFLEEMDLEVGDSISYYAEAWDRGRSKPTISDMYFLEIRPFDRGYRQAEQGGGMGGGDGFDNTLSLQQKMIVSATFRVIRDAEESSDRERSENLTTIALMQERLREQVGALIARIGNRGQQLLEDEEFSKIVQFLQQAGAEMAAARQELLAERPDEALTIEKQALASLQRAESTFRELTVSFQQAGGGGGGGGNQQLSEDLADLFELELDKLRNQYETVERGAAERTQAEVDELMQKLRELARRQQRENERQNRLRGRRQQGGGGGGSQQQLIDEAEELARQLERLSRERQRPELQQTTQALRSAVERMKRSQAGASDSRASAGAEGIAALDKLREARRLLDRDRRSQLGRDMEELQQRAGRLSRMQSRIEEQVEQLARQDGEDGGRQGEQAANERAERVQRIMERKDRLTDEVSGLEAQLNRMTRSAQSEQPEAARKLQESAEVIRDEQLKEKIRYSKGVLAGRDTEFARLFEGQIRQDIDELAERIAEAGESVGEGTGGRQDRLLEQARDLVESVSSLEARLRDRAEAGARLGQRPGPRGEPQQGAERQGGQQEGGQQGREPLGGEDSSGESPSGESSRQPGSRQGDRQGEPGGASNGGGARSPEGGRDWGRPDQVGSAPGGWYQPGVFTAEDLRQFDRELDQRRRDLESLRGDLRRERMDTTDLDRILRQMGDLNLPGLERDPLALESLRRDIVEGLRQFEYRLWRDLRGESAESVVQGNADQVPAGYRELVDEYFRKLANESGPTGASR